jgi:multidrug efflux pump subunit AcrA (membrane-fusion protein)
VLTGNVVEDNGLHSLVSHSGGRVMRLEGEPPVVRKRRIIIGSRRPGEVEVIEGLQAGDLVITHGMEKARVGAGVRIKGREGEGSPITELLKPAPSLPEAGK